MTLKCLQTTEIIDSPQLNGIITGTGQDALEMRNMVLIEQSNDKYKIYIIPT